MTNDKQQRIDESLARQLQRSMERNARLTIRLNVMTQLARTLTAALMVWRSNEMGKLLLDTIDNPMAFDRMNKLIKHVDEVTAQSDRILAENEHLQAD